MPRNCAATLACVVVLLSGHPTESLTVYRVGGADRPPPSLDHPFEFVPIRWDELNGRRHGQSRLIEIRPAYIAPQQMDPDINLVPELTQRGGGIKRLTWRTWQPVDFPLQLLTDGNDATARIAGSPWFTFANVFNYTKQHTMPPSLVWNFDLGGAFSVHRVRFYPRPTFRFARPVQSFLVGLGSEIALAERPTNYSLGPCPMCKDDPQVLDFEIVHREFENTQSTVDLTLIPRATQNVLFQAFPNTRGNWEIAEFEIYADGYAAQAKYTSNIIELGNPAVLGDLRWSGDEPSDTRIELRVRTGNDPDPNTYWRYSFRGDEITRFDLSGQPLDQDSYADLASGERAGIRYDTTHWTPWSLPQLTSGPDPVTIPTNGLRRFIQVQAILHSRPQAAPRLDYIQFSASAPAIERITGNISPAAVEAGTASRFTYTLKPTIVSAAQGFDRFAVETPGQLLDVEGVRLGGEPVEFSLIYLDANRFEIAFPRIDRQLTKEQLEVEFSARIFRFGTAFTGHITDSTRPSAIAQPVEPGDTDPLAARQPLKVDLLAARQTTLHTLDISPPVFTPNGDRVNDITDITYTLVNLNAVAPVRLNVYDLSGRRLCSILRTVQTSGHFTSTWDGRDTQGNRLPPGLYILELSVQTDQNTHRQRRSVSVVY